MNGQLQLISFKQSKIIFLLTFERFTLRLAGCFLFHLVKVDVFGLCFDNSDNKKPLRFKYEGVVCIKLIFKTFAEKCFHIEKSGISSCSACNKLCFYYNMFGFVMEIVVVYPFHQELSGTFTQFEAELINGG